MEDHLTTYPRGIVENLLVMVGKFVFSVDFSVLDMKEGKDIPIILGIPFLSTTRAPVGINDSKHTLRMEDKEITFGVNQRARHQQSMNEVLCVNDLVGVTENKEEVEGFNELEEIERLTKEEILVWNKPKPIEDLKLTEPRASTTMLFEVFGFTTPRVEYKETIMDEGLGNEEEERNSEESILDKMDVEIKGHKEDK